MILFILTLDIVIEVYQEWAGKSTALLNVLKNCLVKVEHDKMLKLYGVCMSLVLVYTLFIIHYYVVPVSFISLEIQREILSRQVQTRWSSMVLSIIFSHCNKNLINSPSTHHKMFPHFFCHVYVYIHTP